MVVLFSKDMPKVDNHKIAVRTKVVSPCMDFMVDASDRSTGVALKEVVVFAWSELGLLLLKLLEVWSG